MAKIKKTKQQDFDGAFDVMFYSKNVVKSVKFYRDILGWNLDSWWGEEHQPLSADNKEKAKPSFAFLSAGKSRFKIHLAQGKGKLGGGAYYHLGVKDVDKYHKAVLKKGGKAKAPVNEPWGWRMFYMEDPDGHLWGFYKELARKK